MDCANYGSEQAGIAIAEFQNATSSLWLGGWWSGIFTGTAW